MTNPKVIAARKKKQRGAKLTYQEKRILQYANPADSPRNALGWDRMRVSDVCHLTHFTTKSMI